MWLGSISSDKIITPLRKQKELRLISIYLNLQVHVFFTADHAEHKFSVITAPLLFYA